MANIYDENYHPKRAYQAMKADLLFAAVQPRIAQEPKR
jgi:endo-1,4-beta-xylanase